MRLPIRIEEEGSVSPVRYMLGLLAYLFKEKRYQKIYSEYFLIYFLDEKIEEIYLEA